MKLADDLQKFVGVIGLSTPARSAAGSNQL
jgi:hypothetical protein